MGIVFRGDVFVSRFGYGLDSCFLPRAYQENISFSFTYIVSSSKWLNHDFMKILYSTCHVAAHCTSELPVS